MVEPDSSRPSFPSFPPTRRLAQRRSTFSSQAPLLGSHIAQKARHTTQARAGRDHAPRRLRPDEALQILDDLNRPLDSLYRDASVTARARRNESTGVKAVSAIIVFFLCAAIGMATVTAVQALQKNTRKSVRQKLASQMSTTATRRSDLEKNVHDLRQQIDKQTDRLSQYSKQSADSLSDVLLTASTNVKGPGVSVSVSGRSLSAAQQSRVTSSFPEGSVTDLDLQEMEDLLWKAGAEALALNNHRIGPQTSLRHAGSSVLVGMQAISPPYVFTAIGDSGSLTSMINTGIGSALVRELGERGITVRLEKKESIVMPAVAGSVQSYASPITSSHAGPSKNGSDGQNSAGNDPSGK